MLNIISPRGLSIFQSSSLPNVHYTNYYGYSERILLNSLHIINSFSQHRNNNSVNKCFYFPNWYCLRSKIATNYFFLNKNIFTQVYTFLI